MKRGIVNLKDPEALGWSLPDDYVRCGDCGEELHEEHEVNGLCPECALNHSSCCDAPPINEVHDGLGICSKCKEHADFGE